MKGLVSNINELPFPSIIRALFLQYFLANQESKAASSHWSYWSKGFEVGISKDGEIEKLRGVGFGDYQTQSLLGRCLEFLTVCFYLILLPRRFKILRQLSLVRSFKVRLTFDTFRQCAIADLLLQALKKRAGTQDPKICIIGDGYGILTALLKKNIPQARFVLIDLGKVLLFQNIFLQSQFRKVSFELLNQGDSLQGFKNAEVLFLPAELVKDVVVESEGYDLAVNVSSMQEMTPDWVAFYFSFLRKSLKQGSGLFYCCNRVRKVLNAGEISDYFAYPWDAGDYFYFDEEPKFYRWFFSQWKTQNRLRIFGVPIPFGRRFDGPARHRLVQFALLKK